MSHIKKSFFSSAFTLVELIVVIVILAILATIVFLSFNSYSSSSRDSTRLSDMTNIAKGLTIQYSIGGKYLIPENYSILTLSGVNIGYQGYAGYNILNTIKISNNGGKDPVDNTYYTYSTNNNQNKYQLLGFLENKSNTIYSYSNNYTENFLFEQTYSKVYSGRYPYERGDTLGIILTQSGNSTTNLSANTYTPIQDTNTGIELNNINTGVVAYIDNNLTTGSGIINTLTGVVGNYITLCSGLPGGASYFSGAKTYYPSGGSSVATYNTNPVANSCQYNCDAGYNWNGSVCTMIGNDSYTKLLLHFDGNFSNAGSNIGIVTNNGGVTFVGGYFSNASSFSGSNYLSMADSSDFKFGTAPFTVDLWYKPANISSQMLVSSIGENVGVSFFDFQMYSGGFRVRDTAGGKTYTYSWSANNWYHLAFVWDGTNDYFFVNGIRITGVGSWTGVGFNCYNGLYIGASYTGLVSLNGILDELRISKGIARRTSNFTPPATQYY